jgi:hypothetical protein
VFDYTRTLWWSLHNLQLVILVVLRLHGAGRHSFALHTHGLWFDRATIALLPKERSHLVWRKFFNGTILERDW